MQRVMHSARQMTRECAPINNMLCLSSLFMPLGLQLAVQLAKLIV
jgi:hypothetical protein